MRRESAKARETSRKTGYKGMTKAQTRVWPGTGSLGRREGTDPTQQMWSRIGGEAKNALAFYLGQGGWWCHQPRQQASADEQALKQKSRVGFGQLFDARVRQEGVGFH